MGNIFKKKSIHDDESYNDESDDNESKAKSSKISIVEEAMQDLNNQISDKCHYIGGIYKPFNLSETLFYQKYEYKRKNYWHYDEYDVKHFYLIKMKDNKYCYAEFDELGNTDRNTENNGICIIDDDYERLLKIYNNRLKHYDIHIQGVKIENKEFYRQKNKVDNNKIIHRSLEEWNSDIKNNCILMELDDSKFLGVNEILQWKYVDDPCGYCGYGSAANILFKQNDNTYGYANYWNGCMTYDPHGTCIIAESLDKIKDMIKLDNYLDDDNNDY